MLKATHSETRAEQAGQGQPEHGDDRPCMEPPKPRQACAETPPAHGDGEELVGGDEPRPVGGGKGRFRRCGIELPACFAKEI